MSALPYAGQSVKFALISRGLKTRRNLSWQKNKQNGMEDADMNILTKSLIALLGLIALSMTSCQTMQGIGRDISSGGSALSNAASR
ncbi:MAG: entericidin A/B family lipoprotein [Rubritalea sp.]|uniref:entericidin A/B family lipoprotein n=1 Tax=Rubritalea sp. TaxID=2109375 RepID=UPI00324215A4